MAINDISLTSGMRSNLVSLQGTVDLLNRTQERLSTGKKVNTALDNPLNFFTAKALNSRASDLAGFKDGMSEAVQTIKAANAGITAIEGLIAQAKAIAATAKAGVANSLTSITVSLASVTAGQTINVGTTTFTAVASDNWVSQSFTLVGLTYADTIVFNGVTYALTSAASAGTDIQITADMSANAAEIASVLGVGAGSGSATTGVLDLDWASRSGVTTITFSAHGTVSTAAVIAVGTNQFSIAGTDDQDASALAAAINTAAITGITAAAVTSNVTITAATTVTMTSGYVAESLSTITRGAEVTAPTTDRSSYAGQFNTIMTQIDLVAVDSGYKGLNFLAAGSVLSVEFGSDPTDKIDLSGFDGSAQALLAKTGSYLATAENNWATNANIDTDIAALARGTATLKTEASRLSSGLSIINTRQDWVKAMTNTLTTGADNLTLADMNEEGANMLMLQTRQTLGTTALSLSAQAAQSVLRLFA